MPIVCDALRDFSMELTVNMDKTSVLFKLLLCLMEIVETENKKNYSKT